MHCRSLRFCPLLLAMALLGACDTATPQARSGDMNPQPFFIDIETRLISDLQSRLNGTRWPDQIPNTDWQYGMDTAYLRELVNYWQNEYDWRERETRLNSFDHFHADIDGMKIHFVHARSADENAIPVLMLHGWPSTFLQMLDIIPLLTNPAAHGLSDAPSFHVVAASLPGFGFSSIPDRPGVGFATSAELMSKLMHDVLGYTEYGVRGSDLGGVIVQQMALQHPDRVLGVHLTGIIGVAGGTPPYTDAEQAFIDASNAIEPEIAYARMQMSKPQTLAQALNDSPTGLAAWIVEKFRAWSDSNGDVESRFSKDALIDNLMLYWLTETAPSAARMYYDFVREPLLPGPVETPVGMLMSTKDLFPAAPREWGERLFNVTHWVETDVGGHFLEWEEPELVARDMQTFFATLR